MNRWLGPVLVILGFWSGEARAEPSVQLSVRLTSPLPAGQTFPAKLRAESLGADRSTHEWEAQVPGELTIELASQSSWKLSLEAAGFWSPDLELPAGGGHPLVSFSLLPAGKVRGLVKHSPQEKVPSAMELRLRSSPDAELEVPSTVAVCPIREGAWECTVPAATLDLRFQAEGFIPSYFWNVRVAPEKQIDLKQLELVRGASLSGWVDLESTPADRLQTPLIELVPSLMGGSSSWVDSDRIRQRSFTVRTTDRGFFQLTGLSAGEYVVTARLEGFSPAQSEPITVLAAAETELREPLLLQRPVALEVVVSPGRDPYGQAWQLELLGGGTSWPPRRLTPAGQGLADATGLWRKEGLSSGHYMLVVRDSTRSDWRREVIQVEPGMPPLDLEIDLVEIEGTILAGEEPVEATLWLQREKTEGQRIRFVSDEDGEFSGHLPSEGTWGVDLRLPREGVQALEPVEVKRLPDSKVARVSIRIPDTRLTVQVADEAGEPVANAQVVVLSEPEKKRREAQVSTDQKGEVILRGLAAGTVQLHASRKEASSDWAIAALSEGGDGEVVRLVLREKLRLPGRLFSPQGPVVGARVAAFPDQTVGVNAWVGRGISEADGTFELKVDQPFPGGSLAVFAPGFAVRLLRMPPAWRAEEPLTFQVGQESGEIVVDTRGGGEDFLNRSRLGHGGGQIPLAAFFWEGLAQSIAPNQFLLPRMEPGEYMLCPAGTVLAGCTRGYLPPNGRLELGVQNREKDEIQGGQP